MGWTQVTSEAQEGTTSPTKVMEIKPPENTEVFTEESVLSTKEEHLVFKLDVRSLSLSTAHLFAEVSAYPDLQSYLFPCSLLLYFLLICVCLFYSAPCFYLLFFFLYTE